MKVILEKERGEIVAELTIPDDISPEIIIWRSRIFVYNPASRHDDAFNEAETIYVFRTSGDDK